jgi:hypothetical protein
LKPTLVARRGQHLSAPDGSGAWEVKAALALAGETLPSHLKQSCSAILAVEQVDKRQHDRTSSFDQ